MSGKNTKKADIASVPDVAAVIGVHRETVYAWIRSGKLTATVDTSGSMLVSLAAARAVLKANKTRGKKTKVAPVVKPPTHLKSAMESSSLRALREANARLGQLHSQLEARTGVLKRDVEVVTQRALNAEDARRAVEAQCTELRIQANLAREAATSSVTAATHWTQKYLNLVESITRHNEARARLDPAFAALRKLAHVYGVENLTLNFVTNAAPDGVSANAMQRVAAEYEIPPYRPDVQTTAEVWPGAARLEF